jgi:SRSO17 transposase
MLATQVPASRWDQRPVSEGTQGPIAYAVACQRVTLCKEGLPARTVWLVSKRTWVDEPTYAYDISNAPASTPLHTFVWLSGRRLAVEQSFEESKTELGLDK